MTNQTTRVLELLKRFNNNQKVCISSLQNELLWERKSEKTIRRDLDVIKSIFPESFELIRGEKGCYKAITKKTFENFLNPQNISLMVQVFSMVQKSDLLASFDVNASDKSIIENKIKDTKKHYEFKNKPYETQVNSFEIFKKLEDSIHFQKYIMIDYEIKNGRTFKEIKPYKIVFINENFYLASEVENEEYKFSLFRVSKIKAITETQRTFYKNLEIEDFIHDIQTPFSTYQPEYRNHLIEIILEVDQSKAFYFQQKKFLKSQIIHEEKENGNLVITFMVTQELEVEELIKRWIPYVKVLQPLSLKNKIESELKDYLA